MADNRTAQLLAASFKGVRFSVRSESVPEAGRKLILHDYVNSNDRFVEDQGQIPPKITIRAFVHGVDFISNANRLERVLNEPGPGLLSSPTFGVLEVYAGAYSKDASQQSVGEISYTIPFFAGRPAPGPSLTRSAIQDVYQAGDNARAAIETVFSEIYPAPQNSANSQAAVGDLNNILRNIENTIKTILPADNLGDIQRTINTIRLNTSKIVREPESLAKQIFFGIPGAEGIWQHISLGLSTLESAERGLEQLILMTNLGGGLTLTLNEINRAVPLNPDSIEIPIWPETTVQRINRNSTRVTLAQANRITSLVGIYEVAASKEYTTDDELFQTRDTIESLHERIMRIEADDYNLIQSKPDVRTAVETVRLASLDVIAQKEQEVFEIDTDSTKVPTSVFVRSYFLYAEDFINSDQLGIRTDQLSKLNSDQPSISLQNEFKVFQVRP